MVDNTPQPLKWLRSWGPTVLFVLALGLVTTTAWWHSGQDLSSAYTGISATLLGLIINPQDEQNRAQRYRWYGMVVLAAAVCVVSVVALVVHVNDATAAKSAAAAVVAAFGALAGIVLDLSKLPPLMMLLGGKAYPPTMAATAPQATVDAMSVEMVLVPDPNVLSDNQNMTDDPS